MKKAIVLLSGGLDSAVTLYLARKRLFSCQCLIFDYGQRHKREIESAKRIAKVADCPYQILNIKLPWKGSSLLDKGIKIPQVTSSGGLSRRLIRLRRNKVTSRVPSTYVPGRNIIFLSFALSFAEAVSAEAIFIGAHSHDYSGYPDCRKEFFQAFNKVIMRGTKSGFEGEGIDILVPLINKRKSEIIKLGLRLGVPFELSWSCYRGGKRPCGRCDSCHFRAKGFAEAGIPDPLRN